MSNVRKFLKAILGLALFGGVIAVVVSVNDTAYRRGFSAGKDVVDSIRDEMIFDLYDRWALCILRSTPGDIVFPSDTATRLLWR